MFREAELKAAWLDSFSEPISPKRWAFLFLWVGFLRSLIHTQVECACLREMAVGREGGRSRGGSIDRSVTPYMHLHADDAPSSHSRALFLVGNVRARVDPYGCPSVIPTRNMPKGCFLREIIHHTSYEGYAILTFLREIIPSMQVSYEKYANRTFLRRIIPSIRVSYEE